MEAFVKNTLTFFIAFFCLAAQSLSQVNERCISSASSMGNKGALYLTTDKTIYTPSEVIWFAAYLLPNVGMPDSVAPNIISVALLKTDTTEFALQKNYFMDEGLCAGSMALSDSVAPGTYQLIAATNTLDTTGKPLHSFRSLITIKSVITPAFKTDFVINDTISKDTVYVSVNVVSTNFEAVGKGNHIKYHLLNQKSKTEKLDIAGSATIAIPRTLLQGSNFVLYTTTTYNKSISYFNLPIPKKKNDSVTIKFYPEGNNLISGLQQKIWWTSFSLENQPIAAKVLLLENSNVIDTLQTNDSGVGLFKLLPRSPNRYSVQTMDTPSPTIFPLPELTLQGSLLKIPTQIPPKDTLRLFIESNQDTFFKIAVISEGQSLPQTSGILVVDSFRTLKMPIHRLSKGVHKIALLNPNDSLLTQRLFFSKYYKNSTADLQIEKKDFLPREKVKLSIALKDAEGNRVSGTFTIYCVLVNRVEPDKKQNIESYYYFDRWLADVDTYNAPALYKNTAWLKNKLAITDINLNTDVATSRLKKVLPEGRVWRTDGARIKESIDLMIFGESSLSALKTDKKGFFIPNTHDIVVSEGNPFWMKVVNTSQKNASDYAIHISDPMKLPMQHLKETVLYKEAYIYKKSSSIVDVLKDPFNWKTLETVKVKSTTQLLSDAAYGNKCGDYVCEGGVINCDHKTGGKRITMPVKGHAYDIRIPYPPFFRSIIYQGCITDNIHHLYRSRRFEGMDSIRLADENIQSNLSTIYWAPFILAEKANNTTVEFFTSDLSGKYKISIEGITTNQEVFHRELFINVISTKETAP